MKGLPFLSKRVLVSRQVHGIFKLSVQSGLKAAVVLRICFHTASKSCDTGILFPEYL